jgi:hypothetical protein
MATTQCVVSNSTHVSISDTAIETFTNQLASEAVSQEDQPFDWAMSMHYCGDAEEGGPLTAQFIFVLDALNWCFWPTEGFEYEHLAASLKAVMESNPSAFTAVALATVTADDLTKWFNPWAVPQLDERVLRVQEVGAALGAHFDGLAMNMIKAADR